MLPDILNPDIWTWSIPVTIVTKLWKPNEAINNIYEITILTNIMHILNLNEIYHEFFLFA